MNLWLKVIKYSLDLKHCINWCILINVQFNRKKFFFHHHLYIWWWLIIFNYGLLFIKQFFISYMGLIYFSNGILRWKWGWLIIRWNWNIVWLSYILRFRVIWFNTHYYSINSIHSIKVCNQIEFFMIFNNWFFNNWFFD